MSISFHDLLPLKFFSKITLVAGERALNNSISWPYCAQTEDISPWVHGHELLFITGTLHDETMLSHILDVCVEKSLAGLVVLIGDEYITSIPDSIIEKANALQVPLFSMPYNLKLLEITKEISDLIIRDTLKREQEQNILNTWLFSEHFEMTTLSSQLRELPFQISAESFCFTTLFLIPQCMQEQIDSIQRHMYSLFSAAKLDVLFTKHENTILCMLFVRSKEKAILAMESIEQLSKVLQQNHFSRTVYYAMGNAYVLSHMRKSYAEAKTTLSIASRLKNREITRFTKLGFYYLLSQSEKLEEKYAYYHQYLEPIINYDNENNGALLSTLHTYLLCNGNVAKTAQQAFVHRNTLLYRLNQIRELTQADWDDAITRMNYLNALILREYLCIKE